MRILITGSEGYIGSELLSKLSDHDIYRYDIAIDLKLDILNRAKLLQVCVEFKPEVIVHLAALKDSTIANSNVDNYNLVNLTGTKNVIEIAELCEVEHLLMMSSQSVNDGDNVYAENKRGLERLALSRKFGYTKCLRLNAVIGASNLNKHKLTGHGLIDCLTKSLLTNAKFTMTGNSLRAYTSLVDTCSLIQRNLISTVNGVIAPNREESLIYHTSTIVRSFMKYFNADFEVASAEARAWERKMHEVGNSDLSGLLIVYDTIKSAIDETRIVA